MLPCKSARHVFLLMLTHFVLHMLYEEFKSQLRLPLSLRTISYCQQATALHWPLVALVSPLQSPLTMSLLFGSNVSTFPDPI